jgi:hypothetical protein
MRSDFLRQHPSSSEIHSGENTMSAIRNFINATCVAIALTTTAVALPAQANSAADQTLKASLDRAKLNYSITEGGNFRLHYTLNNGRKAVVIINSSTDSLRNSSTKIRRIYSIGMPYAGASVPLDIKKQLLQNSNTKHIGSWTTWKHDDHIDIGFVAKVDAEMSPDDLRQVASWVAETADAMEQKLFDVDNE